MEHLEVRDAFENFDENKDPEVEQQPLNDADKLKKQKQSSYTYWVQDNKQLFPQHQDKSVIAPKKIDDPELLKQI